MRKNNVHNMIAEYQQKLGFTAVLISHEIPDVFYFSQRIAMLHEGRIIYSGTPDELQRISDPVINEFIQGFENPTGDPSEEILSSNDAAVEGTTQRFADRVRLQLRITDTCTLIGPNAVLLLLPYTNLSQAKMVCAKLGRALNGMEIMDIQSRQGPCMAISAGFAEVERNGHPERTLAQALARKEIFYQFSVC